jgi:hypothetical protein
VKHILIVSLGLAAAWVIIRTGISLRTNDSKLSSRSQMGELLDPDLTLASGEIRHVKTSPGQGGFRQVNSFLKSRCVRCHGLVSPKAKISLEFESEAKAQTDGALWTRILDAVDSGRMPPAGGAPPHEDELRNLREWATSRMKPTSTNGVSLRRLNRAEFNNTVRDLLGTSLQPANDFPADDSGEGFDNLAQVLSISPTHIEKYLQAANVLIEQARADAQVWQQLSTPPVQDFIPFALRGKPPERAEAVKGFAVRVDDAAIQRQGLEIDRAYYALQAFADRAFRRPITHVEMYRFMQFVEQAISANEPVDVGLARAFKAILVSPHFLFHCGLEPGETVKAVGLQDFELASRLSYFLWSSMPDEPLFRLAAKGELSKPAILNAQVRRMLGDSRSRALADNFAGQWLQIRALAETTRDPDRFPEFGDELRHDMLEETRLFFAHFVRTDRSVLDLLRADDTFLNERLARHYGVDGIVGKEFRQVALSGTERAGLLTHASILTVTANPTRTSPTKRGRWILDNILGSPTSTPPAGADSLAAVSSGNLTNRQRFELHRARTECAGCHSRLDPLGFGFEHFGPTGAWRTSDDDGPVAAVGKLPDGTEFDGVRQLRQELTKRPDDFVRCLTRKLMIYAIGRPLTPADRPTVDAIVQHAATRQYRFSSLVIALVRSQLFRSQQPVSVEQL